MTVTLAGIDDRNERFYYLEANETMIVNGKGGDDEIGGSEVADDLNGGDGNDIVYGLGGDDLIRGGELGSDPGDEVLDGGAGNDRVFGGGGNDYAAGGEGNDIVKGKDGKDVLWGEAGADSISGGAGSDILLGGSGPTTLTFHTTLDWDAIDGTPKAADARLFTYIFGTPLPADDSADLLKGGSGKDFLDGGLGNDVLRGGSGKDTFAFHTALGVDNVDKVEDFEPGRDRIQLDTTVFTELGVIGTLSTDAFHKGNQAADVEDRIIYDKVTGALSYDADGSGVGSAIEFATLSPHLKLTHNDFFVV